MTEESIKDRRKGGDSRVKSVRKAIGILTLLGQRDDGLALGSIATTLSMPKPSAHRFLTTLEDMKCVFYDPETRRWALDTGAFALCGPMSGHQYMMRLLRPYLHRIAEKSGETVSMYACWRWKVLCLAQVRAVAPGRAMGRPGTSFPLHCSAAGKAILASQSQQLVEDYIETCGLYPMTGKTITSSAALKRDLCRTRSHGCATDFDEHEVGLRCIAVPIRNKNGDAVAALSVSGPSARMQSSKMEKLRELFTSVIPTLPEVDLI